MSNDYFNDFRWKGVNLQSESIHADVVVVGGGVAGLSTVIKLAQLAKRNNLEIKICLIEKSAYFGGHIVSGACFKTIILSQLIPDWKDKMNDVIFTKVTQNKLNFLTQQNSIPLPLWKNNPLNSEGEDFSIISLGKLVKNLANYAAESHNVELYSGFGVKEIIYNDDGSVGGVRIADIGIHKDGSPKANFERGLAIISKFTVLAEGCHGNLTKEIIRKFDLRKHSDPPSYSLGLKELWVVDPKNHVDGLVEHNIGFPLTSDTYGGSFVYHYSDDEPLVSLGLVVGLNYTNPYLNPYEELQRMKTHPKFRKLLKDAKRIGYGARTINKGGFQTLPKLTFKGGCIVGCGGGLLNSAQLKGIHYAIGSGIMAGEAIFHAFSLEKNTNSTMKGLLLSNYENMLNNSWIYEELKSTRNFSPSFNTPLGIYGGMLYGGVIWPITKGCEPYTFHSKKPISEYLEPAISVRKINYPAPDNTLTFDLLSSVALTNTNHEYDQPSHLNLTDESIPCQINLKIFDGPEQRYCPAGVFEYVTDPNNPSNVTFQINSQNCLHCKTCDIKDPSQNLNWTVPENGGGGPNYSDL